MAVHVIHRGIEYTRTGATLTKQLSVQAHRGDSQLRGTPHLWGAFALIGHMDRSYLHVTTHLNSRHRLHACTVAT